MNWVVRTTIAVAVAISATAAPAQMGTDGEMFVAKVRDGETGEALRLLESRPSILDAQDSRGETALLAALQRRDSGWVVHLLRAGANPNLAARKSGDTPLIAAARAGFGEAAGWLLGVGAKVDATNKMGETALIVAVQRRDVPLVRFLVANGANPDHQDAAAGYSARESAKRDTRSPEILAAIDAAKPAAKAKPASDKLDDFKLN